MVLRRVRTEPIGETAQDLLDAGFLLLDRQVGESLLAGIAFDVVLGRVHEPILLMYTLTRNSVLSNGLFDVPFVRRDKDVPAVLILAFPDPGFERLSAPGTTHGRRDPVVTAPTAPYPGAFPLTAVVRNVQGRFATPDEFPSGLVEHSATPSALEHRILFCQTKRAGAWPRPWYSFVVF